MKLEKLNPSLKALTVMILVILLSFQYIIALNMSVFLISLILLLLFSNASLKRIASILVPAFVAAFGMFMMGLYYARGNSVTSVELESLSSVPYAVRAAMSQNLETALELATRILAFAGLGIFFALSTNGEDFVKSLIHQARLSPKFAYGILAAFHLMPNMVREYNNVKVAFATRGVKTGLVSRKVIFTMLVNSVRWSECVAMAMESKGFTGKSDRTYYSVTRVHWYDWAFSILSIAFVIVFMLSV